MPRASNPQLADFLTADDNISTANPIPKAPKQRNFRVIHTGDYIPDWIGLTDTGGQYRHITPSFNITSFNVPLVGAGDVNIVSTGGTSQVTGVSGFSFALSRAVPHSYYFGVINACF
jgi:hypothetical protein